MNILRLTDAGLHDFEQYIDSLRTDSPKPFPTHLLGESDFAENAGGDTTLLDALNLENKLETAKGLDALLASIGISSPEHDAGLWSWMSCYLFQRLCKKKKSGDWSPGETARWIADPSNWRRYYRHLLAGIWRIYNAHKSTPDSLSAILYGHVNNRPDLIEQLPAYQELITNSAMMEVTKVLYYDTVKGTLKRGAGGKSGGSPRRLVTVAGQFEKTYDLCAMTSEEILGLLPSEFNRFMQSTQVTPTP